MTDMGSSTNEPERGESSFQCPECGTEVREFEDICPSCDKLLVDDAVLDVMFSDVEDEQTARHFYKKFLKADRPGEPLDEETAMFIHEHMNKSGVRKDDVNSLDPAEEWFKRNEISPLGAFVGALILFVGGVVGFYFLRPTPPRVGPGFNYAEYIFSEFLEASAFVLIVFLIAMVVMKIIG